jgi:hypothetical protein
VGPASGAFTPVTAASGGVSVAPLKTAKVKLKAPSRVRAGSRPVVKVVIKVGGIKKPTGKITIVEKRGNKTKKLGKATLKKSHKGTVKLRLKSLKKGKHKIRALYRGDLSIADGTSRWVKIRAR